MQPKTFISALGIACVTIAFPSSYWTKQAIAQETTLALCETNRYTVRVYNTNGQTYMRAFDRQKNVVWMNQTPASTQSTPQGKVYASLRGEQTVKLLVKPDANNCTIQVGTLTPLSGRLLASSTPNSNETLNQARQLYPEQVAKLEGECRAPETLSVEPYQNQGEPQRANFICWSKPDADGSRSGTWLGTLPLTQNDSTFVEPFTCPAEDQKCQANLSLMRSRYPQQLQEAEFACAMKKGTLFFAQATQAVDIRCGYFATNFYDEDGNGEGYIERPTSVDTSVGRMPLLGK